MEAMNAGLMGLIAEGGGLGIGIVILYFFTI